MEGGLSFLARHRMLAVWLGLPWPARIAWTRRKLGEAIATALGRGGRIRTADRELLETKLLPGFAADASVQRLLFVGCEAYTRDYEAMFGRASGRFRTIDVDRSKAAFGSAGHVVAPLQEVDRHVEAESVDVVVCNGVYGWGLDDRASLLEALEATARVTKPGGRLVLGWNDVPVLGPFDPEPVAREAGFARESGDWRRPTATPTRHTFDFYRRDPSLRSG